MGKLATLKENRKQAQEALRAVTDELEAVLVGDTEKGVEARAWTPDEEKRLADARGKVESYDRLIVEAETQKREAEAQQEERDRKLGLDPENRGGAHVTNGAESLTYSESNPDNSFIRDLYTVASPQHPQWEEARARLRKHQEEFMAVVSRASRTSKEGRAALAYVREEARFKGSPAYRAVSTQAASMGDFAPPIYFLPEYAAYRTYGRTLIDQLKHYPLPETGLVINVPKITQPSQAINQTNSATQGANENTSVTERDLTTTYQSGTLQTIIDNVNVSQQYLDRVGPGIEGDMIIREDMQRQMNRSLNKYGWDALFAAGGYAGLNFPLPGGDTTFNAAAAAFRHVLGGAKAAISTTDGTVAYPTHFFADPTLWEQIEASYDSNNRPFVVPQGVAFNPSAVGDTNPVPEGYTGFHYASVQAFKDDAMWVSWNGGAGSAGQTGNHPALVGALDIAAYWLEGSPVYRVLPQPGAATLTVLIQTYVYCAYVPLYPTALQVVVGSGTADALVSAF